MALAEVGRSNAVRELLQQVDALKRVLDRAADRSVPRDAATFREMRRLIVGSNLADSRVPPLLSECRDLTDVRDHLMMVGATPSERRAAIRGQLAPLYEHLEALRSGQGRAVRAQRPASLGVALHLENLHPDVVGAAGRLFQDRHYAQAVFEAFKRLEVVVRELTGSQNSGQKLMGEAFGGDPPRIRLSDLEGKSGQDQHEGYKLMFMGAMAAIRNPGGHEIVSFETPQQALEQLALASLLFRQLERAVVRGLKLLSFPSISS